jgi:hypothetical protein
VVFDGAQYRATAAHTSDPSHIPPNAPTLWLRLTPVPACQPRITVSVSTITPVLGQPIVVSASGNVGLGLWSLAVIDAATGQVQDQSNPIVMPAQPAGINHSGTAVSWTVTAARAGRVVFRVSVYGESQIPPSCAYAFTGVAALSPTVSVAGPLATAPGLVLMNHGALDCDGQVVTPMRLEWGAIGTAFSYNIAFGGSATGPFAPYVSGFTGTKLSVWDPMKYGYYQVTAWSEGGGPGASNVVMGTWAVPACPVP